MDEKPQNSLPLSQWGHFTRSAISYPLKWPFDSSSQFIFAELLTGKCICVIQTIDTENGQNISWNQIINKNMNACLNVIKDNTHLHGTKVYRYLSTDAF